MQVAVFAGGNLGDFERSCGQSFDYVVGVDRGCVFVLEQGLSLDLAVGDFDSVTADEFVRIQAVAGEMLLADAEKDETDTGLALQQIFARFAKAQVTVFGAFGGRLDHELSNIFLPSNPGIAPFMRQICLKNADNHLQYFPKGCHIVQQIATMHYVAIMNVNDGQLTISQAKYPLNADNFFYRKIYSSNEFVDGRFVFEIGADYAVVIQSK